MHYAVQQNGLHCRYTPCAHHCLGKGGHTVSLYIRGNCIYCHRYCMSNCSFQNSWTPCIVNQLIISSLLWCDVAILDYRHTFHCRLHTVRLMTNDDQLYKFSRFTDGIQYRKSCSENIKNLLLFTAHRGLRIYYIICTV